MLNTKHLKTALLPAYLVLCLLLGGASAAGFVGNAVLQVIAVAILARLFWTPKSVEHSANAPLDARLLYVAFALAVAWVLISWIPLPPVIWHALPGRGSVEESDALLAMTDNWRSISIQPTEALVSIFALLPPFAVLALTLRASERSREATLWSIIGFAVLSSLVGLIQLSQGMSGPAYFYAITNYGTSVGFFANSNHLATLFLIALVLSAEMPFGQRADRRGNGLAWQVLRAVVFLFFVINLILNKSVAGYGLSIAAVAYWLLRNDRVRTAIRLSLPRLMALSAIVAGAVLASIWLLSNRLAGLAFDPLKGEERVDYVRNTWHMIVDSFPVGYGLGSFRWSYAGIEPIDRVTTVFVNHAHNDYLELLSDFGLVGLALLAIFGLWFVRRIRWLATTRVTYPQYCLAAAMGIVLVAAHSIVDYPIRTAAIATIFAFLAACIARPVVPVDETRHRSRRRRA
ncbi:O-antigen ligase family protein [Sphingorhabdus soli]|uniref:O-antigen ligase family protein n=1 Tax=Flavisphingopyxis soli TaxID=2601267 RepID=A0A5C6UPZ0_9SPHN|nr:O-antigen ligase family protein [Sphingorhabdus soli]TXC74251.1 O-antigen ligase family protein [Sphingorhabdus soli]